MPEPHQMQPKKLISFEDVETAIREGKKPATALKEYFENRAENFTSKQGTVDFRALALLASLCEAETRSKPRTPLNQAEKE